MQRFGCDGQDKQYLGVIAETWRLARSGLAGHWVAASVDARDLPLSALGVPTDVSSYATDSEKLTYSARDSK